MAAVLINGTNICFKSGGGLVPSERAERGKMIEETRLGAGCRVSGKIDRKFPGPVVVVVGEPRRERIAARAVITAVRRRRNNWACDFRGGVTRKLSHGRHDNGI